MNPAETPAIVLDAWPYVWSAYAVTWAFLAGYALSLFVRGRGSGEGG